MLDVVILFAGRSDDFKPSGFDYPKNLVEIAGLPLVQRVLENLAPLRARGASFICMVRREENRRFHTGDVIHLIEPDARVIEINADTGGAVCTALTAIDALDPARPLVVTNGDVILDLDPCQAIDDFVARDLDAGAIAFPGVHPRWSFIRLDDDGLALEVAEKRPISNIALTGFSWFRTGTSFVEAASAMLLKDAHVDGAFYVAPVFNELILENRRVGAFRIPRESYHSLKTPRDIAQFEASLSPGTVDHGAIESVPQLKLYAAR